MTKRQLFISHVSLEAELAERLKNRLDRDFLGMLAIFVSSDRDTIVAGAKWLEELDQALKQADLQIVLCSKESVERPWVNFEAGGAWLRGIPVIPVCHSGLDPNDLPLPLSLLQGVLYGQPSGLRKLYDAVARALDVETPSVDFDAVAAEMREVEERYRLSARVTGRIENPAVLCAASEHYAQPSLGFHLDVAIMESTFGAENVTVERSLTAKRLRALLTGKHFDIVHLVIPVDPVSGSLLFNPVGADGKSSGTKIDAMSASSFAQLLVESQTRLVVLATCKALLLAVNVAHVANMAASDADISGEDAAEWEECFYGFLAQGKSVHKAFDLIVSQLETPIRPVRQLDVTFALHPGAGTSGRSDRTAGAQDEGPVLR